MLKNIVLFFCNDSCKRHEASTKGFSKYQYIRGYKMLAGKHLPGATKPFDDLIKNQEHVITLCQRLYFFPVPGGRNYRCCRYRFTNNRCHIGVALKNYFHLPQV